MLSRPKQPIAYIQILSADNIVCVAPSGSLCDLGLPDPDIYVIISLQLQDCSHWLRRGASTLGRIYISIFHGPQDYSLIKGTSYRLELKDDRPIWSWLYQKYKVKEAQVAISFKNSWMSASYSLPIFLSLLPPLTEKEPLRPLRSYELLPLKLPKNDNYHLPSINESLHELCGYKFFSAMDLKSGYWQVKLSHENMEKFTLSLAMASLNPRAYPQGFFNAPVTFQIAMDNIPSYLKIFCVLVYLDYIIVFFYTLHKHITDLRLVFDLYAKPNSSLSLQNNLYLIKKWSSYDIECRKMGLRPFQEKLIPSSKFLHPLASGNPSAPWDARLI